MRRFVLVNSVDEIFNKVIKDFVNENYKWVKNSYTGGDNDILIIDTLNKCFTYGEFGSCLVSDGFLDEFSDSETLSNIIKKSYEYENFFGE